MLAWDMLDMDTPMLDMDMDTTLARGLLMPRLRLTLLFFMVPMDTLVLAMLDTEDLATLPMLDILIPDMDTLPTLPTDMDTTLERGLLMLSPRLRLIPLSSMVPMDMLVLAMLDMLVLDTDVLMLDTHTWEGMLDMVDMPGENK